MKLREILQEIKSLQNSLQIPQVWICGGTPRDKFMNRLDNISDLDLTNGEKSIDYLSEELHKSFQKKYQVSRKTMEDGHSSIFIGNLKLDFSSHFLAPNIEQILQKKQIKISSLQEEMFSRDFTCNSLLLSLDLEELQDPTQQALQDIHDKMIRTCLDPSVTLTCNRNRVVRAIYLSSKLQFNIDSNIIDFVRKNPNCINLSTKKAMTEKLNLAFEKNPELASENITKMNLWKYLPINSIMYPYYLKYNKYEKKI